MKRAKADLLIKKKQCEMNVIQLIEHEFKAKAKWKNAL